MLKLAFLSCVFASVYSADIEARLAINIKAGENFMKYATGSLAISIKESLAVAHELQSGQATMPAFGSSVIVLSKYYGWMIGAQWFEDSPSVTGVVLSAQGQKDLFIDVSAGQYVFNLKSARNSCQFGFQVHILDPAWIKVIEADKLKIRVKLLCISTPVCSGIAKIYKGKTR